MPKFYIRWALKFDGGGHVNRFRSPAETAALIERAAGLPHLATRTLYSSLAFLNRSQAPRPLPRRLWLLGGGFEWTLFLYAWGSRRLDRVFHTRSSVYGWAFYFGAPGEPIDTVGWVNVCIRCGAGHPAAELKVRRKWGVRIYRCPACGAVNPFAAAQVER